MNRGLQLETNVIANCVILDTRHKAEDIGSAEVSSSDALRCSLGVVNLIMEIRQECCFFRIYAVDDDIVGHDGELSGEK